MYIVVHSQDPYLLARMATDLQMEGFKTEEEWSIVFNPFNGRSNCEWIKINIGLIDFEFHNHSCIVNADRLELTTRNYITTLSFILKNKDK